MHSEWPERGQKRHHGDRDRRWRDDYNDRWGNTDDHHRDVQWVSYNQHDDFGPGRAERNNRGTDYSDSPQKLYSKDSLDRDRDGERRSPVRRRLSSLDSNDKKRQRFTDDSCNDYYYRYELHGKKYWQSQDSYSKDFRHALPQEVDFNCRSMEDSRSRQKHEEYHKSNESSHRQLSTYNKDDHERNHSFSLKKLPQDDATKRYVKSRERKNSSPTDYVDHCQNRAKNYLDGSQRLSFEHVSEPNQEVPQKKAANGFQRFLDVLNKGVDVDILNQIVIQTSPDSAQSEASFRNVLDRASFPKRQVGQLNVSEWNEENFGEDCNRLPFQQQCLGSFDPKRTAQYDDMSLQRSDGGEGCMGSMLLPLVEKKTLTPEDEHKHHQMQEVLQAIGVDLGFEEVGQMSHRINERLYGKKEHDWSHQSTGSGERITRAAYSPGRCSRSSSSSSHRSKPVYNDSSVLRNSYNAQSDLKVDQVQVPYTLNNSSSLPGNQKCEIHETIPPNTTITTLIPSMLTTPGNYPPVLYPPLFPNVSNIRPRLLIPPLPSLFRQSPMFSLPGQPPLPPFPCPSPFNILPSVLAQTSHLLPQSMNNITTPLLNLPNVPTPLHSVDYSAKSKMISRPRCLRAIDTKKHK
ncbi:uncharacterized protein LOC133506457 isoform X5 [Syngnathoides biaculeatus]|uniref:uncharacterized protein LOC133506457 isoform X5 n=1 Tax=Syngnathoides biaculeatus TaxID=300417 RepID=UPI002ADD5D32|nr:uncharacterized protein LOC133506457 isoform X5 [Syngnathoides biaculeatus]